MRRVFRDVYVPAATRMTHEIRCRSAALILPSDAVITGRSAATVRGVPLAQPADPVEIVVGLETRIFRRTGLDVRRCKLRHGEAEPWCGVALARPPRIAFDLLLDRALPDAVADLDAVLRVGVVDRGQVERFLRGRHDRGIVQARRAVQLADPRAESRPESRMRVWLVLDGLAPEVQYWVHQDGRRICRVDLAFPERRLAVEYDGGVARGPASRRAGPRAVEPTARRRLGRRVRHRPTPARAAPHGVHRAFSAQSSLTGI